MKSPTFAALLCLLLTGIPTLARADLESALGRLNVQARADLGGFAVKLSAQFGVPAARVETVLRSVETPADAFMCLQLAELAQRPPEAVVETYRANRGKGWGAIAKELGVKPGSAEFHALKRGDFALTGEPGGGRGKGKGKGKGKNKNRDKDK